MVENGIVSFARLIRASLIVDVGSCGLVSPVRFEMARWASFRVWGMECDTWMLVTHGVNALRTDGLVATESRKVPTSAGLLED